MAHVSVEKQVFTLCGQLTSAFLLIFVICSQLVAQTERTTAYGVLLDNTLSLEKQFPEVVMVGKQVIKRIHKAGPVALFTFTPRRDTDFFAILNSVDRYEGGSYLRAVGSIGTDLTQDEDALNRYVDGLATVKGQTDLFGAITLMTEFLVDRSRTRKPPFTDKVIILVTDGDHRMEMIGSSQPSETEDGRRNQERQLLKRLQGSGIKVYAVGFTRGLETGSPSNLPQAAPRYRAQSFLGKLTKETGGRVVFPKSKDVYSDALASRLLGP